KKSNNFLEKIHIQKQPQPLYSQGFSALQQIMKNQPVFKNWHSAPKWGVMCAGALPPSLSLLVCSPIFS
ncbi:TPA: hypothetical protein ACGO3B_001920, partial [Streptococcus suis]